MIFFFISREILLYVWYAWKQEKSKYTQVFSCKHSIYYFAGEKFQETI